MEILEHEVRESAIGGSLIVSEYGPNITFRNYICERPAPSTHLKCVEAILDIAIRVSHPVTKVWPVFTDFNSWMNRFGYVWEGEAANNEDRFIYLGNTGASNDLAYGSEGHRTRYIVRKVIPGQLIYLHSFPIRVPGKDAYWSGNNVLSVQGENDRTHISVCMEHTWYSETLTTEEIRREANTAMFEAAPAFWRDYFIPDLIAQLDTRV